MKQTIDRIILWLMPSAIMFAGMAISETYISGYIAGVVALYIQIILGKGKIVFE